MCGVSPNAILNVSGTKKSNQSVPWTVITGRNLQVTGGANLVINSNFTGLSIPVPAGAGPRAGGRATLIK